MSEDMCDHKWKIIKQFKEISKSLMGKKLVDTIYHLQCEKCGDLKSRRAQGFQE